MGTPEGFVIDPDGALPLDLSGRAAIAQVTNLLPNPSFEYDTPATLPAGWASTGFELNTGSTPIAQAVVKFIGSQSMRILTNGSHSDEGAVAALPGTFSSGVAYTFSMYLRGASGGESTSLIIGVGSDIAATSVNLTTSFQRISVTWTPSADRTGVSAVVQVTPSSALTVYADAGQVIQGSAPVDYFDGDTTGYLWSGTPGDSTSVPLPSYGVLRLAGLTIPPAPKRPEWASNGDTDGQALVRNPLHDNRSCSMQVRVNASDMDTAMTAIGTLQGKLQEACIQGAGNGPGLPFLWTPSGATTGLTGQMLYAEITDLPVTYDDGWFASKPVVTVTFQAAPFLEGDEVTGPTASGTTPLLTVEVDDVPGDVPATARLVVTDGTAQPRRWVEWGLESEYYNVTSPAPVFVDSASVVTSGFAGVGTAVSGAFGGSVVGATLYSQPLALCGTGNLAHVGTFRVKARVVTTSPNQFWRLSWQAGDSDLLSNDWVQPVTSNIDYTEMDFGLVTIEPAEVGTQQWSGRVEAYTTDTSGTLFGGVDYLAFIPVDEGYGRMEAAYSYQPGVIAAHDDFSNVAAGSALNGHVAAQTGGTWATSGVTTDFAYSTDFSDHWVKRSTNSDASERYAILGSATPSNIEVGVTVRIVGVADTSPTFMDAIARWTSSAAHLRLVALFTENELLAFLQMEVSGTPSVIATAPTVAATDGVYSLRLIVYASGRALGWVTDASGQTLAMMDASDPNLATGGTLATGKSGILDQCLGGGTLRYYKNFYTATPATEPVIINSGKSVQIRSDSNLRQSASGSTYGNVASRGSRLFIPQAGDPDRSSRIVVRAVREDPITQVSRNDGDSTQLAVFYKPRFLAVPRS